MGKYFMHTKERNHAKLKNMLEILRIKSKSKIFQVHIMIYTPKSYSKNCNL